ncbi:NRDE family protein [Sphingobacterium sp. DN00404]|uniref:NRDE family protein n=1 Tax=Sphingobacterium micropteri TaxID=2763501 RepID=A0ABR7YJ63_9SPHI|nr:NRDE family protein [Sphingobacterium micropteri]MBD1431355.1 NRDE family protein [Sphingobacterium micropteri]
MCTVTYIPTLDGFYFTSSRDEKASRATIPPMKHRIDGIDLIYPKDEIAGGTWIAAGYNGRTACLLNGAFHNHVKQKSYRRSRGLILLESFKHKSMYEFSNVVNLNGVEPFTIISLIHLPGITSEFTEFRWDGTSKHLRQLDIRKSQIWSSATLYNSKIQLQRTALFEDWIKKFKDVNGRNILAFHSTKHGLNVSHDIIMKGEDDLMTLSISQLHFNNGNVVFKYYDILNDKAYVTGL